MIHATVIGNLGRDAEVRMTTGGKAVCNFTIAARGRDKNAEATWVRCALWGARGEKVSSYLKKGGRVAVSGTLTTSEYEGKSRLELDVSELELLGDGKRSDEQEAPPQRRGTQQRQAPRATQDDFGDYSRSGSDEIPF